MSELDVPELVPLEEYDAQKVKLQASIRWLLDRAYGQDIPPDYREAFYEDRQGDLQLKPVVVKGLVTSEIYCAACARLFKEPTTQYEGHMCVIQGLCRRGFYVMDIDDSAVTEAALVQTAPFRMISHLALMDTLMAAHANQLVTVERVVQAVRQFATLSASSELPDDVDGALMVWINKVCSTVKDRIEQKHGEGRGPSIPVVQDLLKDVNDGCCLAALFSFYCPTVLPLQDIALTDAACIADSLYNLQLVMQFCQSLPDDVMHMSLNDLFYTPEILKPNLLVFLAELFYGFEVTKNFIIEAPASEERRVKSAGGKLPTQMISNATKRSFQQNSSAKSDVVLPSSFSAPDLHKAAGNTGVLPSRQPLLQKRLQQPRTDLHQDGDLMLQSAEERGRFQHSLRAWEDSETAGQVEREGSPSSLKYSAGEPQRAGQSTVTGPGRAAPAHLQHPVGSGSIQSSGKTLLGNVSIDSDMSFALTSDRNSFDVSSMESTPRTFTNNPLGPIIGSRDQGRMSGKLLSQQELQAVTPRATTSRSPHMNPKPDRQSEKPTERLMPAAMKPAKEKFNNHHTKEIESGETIAKKSPSSPVKPPKTLNIKSQSSPAGNGVDSSGSSTPSEEYQTPSVENVPFLDLNKGQSYSTATSVQQQSQPTDARLDKATKNIESIKTDQLTLDRNLPVSAPRQRVDSEGPPSVAQSFTLHDQPHTVDSARAAGIPVVPSFGRQTAQRDLMERSSSEGSDQELRKIHADHRTKEVKMSPRPAMVELVNNGQRPDSLSINKPIRSQSSEWNGVPAEGSDVGLKTSFADLRKQQANGKTSPLFCVRPGGVSPSPSSQMSLKDQFQKAKKKTTFAALPNQTTWQESARKASDASQSESSDAVAPMPSELFNIRMELEEKRRQIEGGKRRIEAQWNKQRQRLGKQAFIQVISKGKPPTPEENEKSTLVKDEKTLNDSTTQSPHKTFVHVPEVQAETVAKPTQEQSTGSRAGSSEKDIEMPRANMISSTSSDGQTDLSKTFSRQTIQDKIDDVRNRWFSGGEGEKVTDEKSKSFHAAETRSAPQQNEIPRQLSKSTSSVQENKPVQYNASLDKLNSSLTELQSEIMRLSLQQDQIKHMVAGETESKRTPTPPPVRTATTPPPAQDRYYKDTQLSAGEPDIAGAHPSYSYTQTTPQPTPAVTSMYGASHPIIPYPAAAQAYAPQYAALGQYQPPYMPGFPVGQQPYPAIPTSFQTSPPMYPQHTMYQGLPPQGSGYPAHLQQTWQSPSPQPQYPAGHPGNIPLTTTYQPQTAETHTVSSYQTQVQSPVRADARSYAPESPHVISSPIVSSPYANNARTPSSPPHPTTPHIPTPTSPRPPPSPLTQMNMHSQSQPSPRSPITPGQTWVGRSPHDTPQDVPEQDNVGEEQGLHREGFFISFGSEAQRKQKPKLSDKDRRREKSKREDRPSADQPPFSSPASMSQPSSSTQNTPQFDSPSGSYPTPSSDRSNITDSPSSTSMEERRVRNMSPGVGFVIDTDSPVPQELSDIEKKKQRMIQQQNKRREEQEKKRLKQEAERQKKREEQQLKQEMSEQKKAEEKARREEIFQQYLNRKEEREAAETAKTKTTSVVHRRQKNKKAARPKSQPPVSGIAEDKFSSPSSYSSQEDLRGRSPAPDFIRHPGHLITLPPGDMVDTGNQLAYGGLTHRRNHSPEKTVRINTDNNSESSSNPEYAGPKLFVKPSQKSNRHIIMNAISHCCLAGIVNQETKNKVLEAITGSESKHFVILFRDAGQMYRSLYSYDPDSEEMFKVLGVGPKQLNHKMLDRFYKYNSGAKNFTQISTTKHMSSTIDAVTIQGVLWKNKPAPRKPPAGHY